MRVVQQPDEHQWRAFVDAHPRGNIFHTPDMFQVFARTAHHCPEVWAVVDDASRMLALMVPVRITLVNGLLRKFTTRAVVYGGTLCEESAIGQAALRLLLKTYADRRAGHALFTELRNLHEYGDLQSIFANCGYVYEDHLTYLIDLNRPAEQIMSSIGTRTRKQIRKGLRDGLVEICTVNDRADLGSWYAVLRQTYRNAQVPLADRSLFEAAFDVLYPRGLARFLVARVQGEIAACSIELCYKRTIYGWYGGSDRAYSKYLPNELLIWNLLEWGAGNGYQLYDFGGAGKQNEEYGVRAFKAKFGGDLVSYGRYTCVHSPHLLRLSRLGYSIYRSML